MTSPDLNQAADMVRAAGRLAVLTGAGISAESGLATFRGAGGLWAGQRIEDVATPQAFARDPQQVWRFYNARRAGLATVRPNPGHVALVALEDRLGPSFTLVTQNVDGLHQAAGSRNVLEIHGSIRRVRCTACHARSERPTETLSEMPTCTTCQGLLRPDVVWFGEMLPLDIWARAELAVQDCDCFLVIGTSAFVYPAAGLIMTARDQGARVIEINLDETDASRRVALSLRGPSGVILPELLRLL
ncbi:MAG: NAD-dependent deacylase [Planctomycetes bacterium]|nr:NAD-dependent deacylase [Planctomycetota bacterium]